MQLGLVASLLILPLCAAEIDYDSGPGPGRITYYDQTELGACDIPSSEWPPYTAALDEVNFKGGLACGATANLTNGDKTIQVMVVDLCPTEDNLQWCSGDVPHFDLGGSETFGLLEPVATGVKSLTFEWVPTPVGDSPVKIRYKDGVNQWWVALEVINHRYPVANFEIKDPQSGEWLAGDRTLEGMWNYWQFDFAGAGLTAPYEIRLTDQYGQVISAAGEPVEENTMWSASEQFPLLEKHGGTKVQTQKPSQPRIFIQNNLLTLDGPQGEILKIYDVQGNTVFHTNLTSNGPYPLPKLFPGMYHISLLKGKHSFKKVWLR